MRIAVAGATGRIGSLTVAALERDGHEVRRISPKEGVDVRTGSGLEPALTGVGAVIDTVNSTAPDRAETVGFFTTTTRNLLAAEERAGVRHHVTLSIAACTGSRGTRTTRASGRRKLSWGRVRFRSRSFRRPSSTISRAWSRPGRRRMAPPWSRPC
jgi:uncharacterized protein YbjT (DUF2867 family)